ncbi:MAG: type II/IV secretion system protein [Candidatus Pacebacteria bacterium]|jgi:type IV pilus assembly protein PilB|nr:type II/IV secretion system protein [Candidatus Paceibacterota bacterium]
MLQFDEEKQQKQLEDLKQQEEEDLVSILAASKYNIPYINLAGVVIDNEALRIIPEDEARVLGIAPFKLVGKKAHVAILSPRPELVSSVEKRVEGQGFSPVLYMASHASVEKVWKRYHEISLASASKSGGLDISNQILLSIADKVRSITDIKGVVEEVTRETHKTSQLLEVLLGSAIALDASDVHIEPEQETVRLRYRLDGLLHDAMVLEQKTNRLLNSRIKLLSGMKITAENTPQDGRFSIFLKSGEEVNIRTSTIPSAYGETIVMRVLNPKSIKGKLEDLGMEPRLFEIVNKEITKPHGLILLTGPTGSGKTTTLYAFLRKIYNPEIKIITIEDPIEYHITGITQTQADHKKGFTFLEGLRSALRQDPDVVMVGEIRDAETAKIAVEAALTGHMVFSTLHTNNAAGVIPRLIDLEVNPKIIPSALSVSMAQRLIRKLCEHCKKERTATQPDDTLLRKILESAAQKGKELSRYGVTPDQKITLWEPVGCEKCDNTGYKGRIGVFEAILTNEAIEKIIPENPSEREIKRVAQTQGILDMKEDGIIKALHGITSLEEVRSVVDIEED